MKAPRELKRACVRMAYYVYIILCQDNSFYTGHTKNVDERTRLHTCGKGARYTRMHKPQKVVYVEPVDSRAMAMKRERAIKKLSHQQKINLIDSNGNQK